SLGGNSRLVVAQMSQRQDFILWEGTPEEMRAKFPSPEVFNRFLKDQSDPQSSPVYEATEEAVNYVSAVHGVAPSTRLLTVILSDMIDSSQDPQEKQASGNRMLAALQGYQQRGGSLALYCVAPEETRRWQRIVDMAGFKSGQFVIQSSLVENPILPKLD
ncbi:MAG: hypothetical protein KDB03_27880, partial [Planctomycetales bacterium]|nr:hypothetical protein [Planctomycetales bacterium]